MDPRNGQGRVYGSAARFGIPGYGEDNRARSAGQRRTRSCPGMRDVCGCLSCCLLLAIPVRITNHRWLEFQSMIQNKGSDTLVNLALAWAETIAR